MKSKPNPIKYIFKLLWRGITLFFGFLGNLLLNIARKFRLSIAFKITFAFVGLTLLLGSFFSTSPFFKILAVPLIAIFGHRAVKTLLHPIQTMTADAKKLSGNNLGQRLDVHQAQDELRDMAMTFNAMLDRVEASMEDQKAFISHASHELRTPLSVIKGYSELLERWGKEDPAVRDEALEAIRSESENMHRLVEKLLVISRMDYGSTALEASSFSLDELLREVAEEYRIVKGKSPELQIKLEALSICADRLLMKELLRIFLDNAYQYTPAEGVLRLTLKSSPKALLIIEDSGQGIASEHLPHIFDAFYRADHSRTRNTGGTGLGLTIARRILDLHGYSIQVQSELGKGTRFQIELPGATTSPRP